MSHNGSSLYVSSLRLNNNPHDHRTRHTSRGMSGVSLLRLMLVLLWISSSCQVQCLKHSFHTFADSRTLIGPVGVPFGFATGGEYHLSVLDFNLHLVPEKKKKKDTPDAVSSASSSASTLTDNEILKRIEPGFFLERFPNEAAFHQHMERLRTNASACAFEYFHDHDDLDNSDNEDFDYYEAGKITSANHGILLSMKARKKWNIATPSTLEAGLNSIQYTFQNPSEQGLYFLIYQVCASHTTSIVNGDGGSSTIYSSDDVFLRRVRSTFELDFHFFNVDPKSGKRSYLTAGEMKLPFIFFFFSMSYLLCTILWVMNNCNIQKGGPGLFHDKTSSKYVNLRHAIRGAGAPRPSPTPPTVYKIHHLMSIFQVSVRLF
jgi:hypothetical protein